MSRKLMLHGSMSGDTSSEACLSRVIDWIDECMSSHPSCKEGDLEAASLPRRVLDLNAGSLGRDIKLVETQGEFAAYVCLSYCWGGINSITTTKSTLPLRSAGISMDSLPQTFKDAIDVTRRLKVRYLWIDALCIIQDDKQDWEIESGHMASIYANSYLTVAATQSANCTEGLYSKAAPGYGSTRQLVHTDTNESTTIHIREKLDHRQLFYSSGLSVDATYPLIRRSWCFQERLLAPRTLHFMSGEVAWECNTTMHCECSGLDCHGDSFNNPKVTFQLGELGGKRGDLLKRWHDIVHSYIRLSLTFDSDRLPALSGLAKRMQKQLGCGYLAGLWSCDLWNELRWRFHDEGRLLDERRAYTPSQYRGPSWSWVAVENLPGQIYYSDSVKGIETDFCFLHLLDVQCLPRGEDPTGEVDCAFLKVAGYVRPATLGRYYGRDSAFPGDEHFTIRSGKWTSKFLADCPQALNNGKERIEDGQELFCLRMGLEHLLDPSGQRLAQSSTSSSIGHLLVREKRRLVEADRSSSSAGPDEIAELQFGHRSRHVPSRSNSISEQSVPERPPLTAPDPAVPLGAPQDGHDSPSKSSTPPFERRRRPTSSSTDDISYSPRPRRIARRPSSTDSYISYSPGLGRITRRLSYSTNDSYISYSPGPGRITRRLSYSTNDSYISYSPGPRRITRRLSYPIDDSNISYSPGPRRITRRLSNSTDDSYLGTSDDSLDSDCGESSALSPTPSLILGDLPHLPSVSDDQLDDGPAPPAPENDAVTLGKLIMHERVPGDPRQERKGRGGVLPSDYLVLRRLGASEHRARAGALYGRLLEGTRHYGDSSRLPERLREEGEEGGQRQQLGEDEGRGGSFEMYERIGLIPQWEITVEQDAEWFADVEESLIVIV